MSNPQPQPGYKLPPRAEPVQPDRPLSGDDVEKQKPASDAADVEVTDAPSADKQKAQSKDALDNVREGY
jgi:hypothetical protein